MWHQIVNILICISFPWQVKIEWHMSKNPKYAKVKRNVRARRVKLYSVTAMKIYQTKLIRLLRVTYKIIFMTSEKFKEMKPMHRGFKFIFDSLVFIPTCTIDHLACFYSVLAKDSNGYESSTSLSNTCLS